MVPLGEDRVILFGRITSSQNDQTWTLRYSLEADSYPGNSQRAIILGAHFLTFIRIGQEAGEINMMNIKSSRRLDRPWWARTFFLFILIAFLMLFTPRAARADVAPPQMPPGANPIPGEEVTQVRMVWESVLIDVPLNPEGSLGTANVTAEFHMQNLSDVSETLNVRFPLSANDGRFNYPEILDFQVTVDGQPVAGYPITLQDPAYGDDPVQWTEFEVTFPPGVEVVIVVTYTLQGTGEYPYVSYVYLLHTGAGWKDTIGTVNVTVRLPYEANPYNVFVDSSPGWDMTTPGARLIGNEIRWRYEDLEPERKDNIAVVMVWPDVWDRILTE